MKLLVALILSLSTLFCAEKKTLIITLGMHRSGSSLITNTLERLGAELGDHLLPAHSDNPKGFFEDIDIGMFNETLLYLHGLAAHSVKLFPTKLINEEMVVAYGKKIVLKKLEGRKSFCFKDPRTARNFLVWRKIIDQLPTVDTHLVLIVRNPISVAQSLYVRNGIDPTRSYFMWLLHYLSAVHYSKGLPLHIVHYEEILSDPEGVLRRICTIPGLNETKNYDFVDSNLQHHLHTIEELEQDFSLPSQLLAFYKMLKRKNREDDELSHCVSQILNYLNQIDFLLQFVDREMQIGENKEFRGFPLIGELISL